LIDDGPNGAYDSKAFREAMEGTARRPGTIFRDVGDFAGALASVDEKVEAEVTVPRLARAAMEPPSVTARIVDGEAKVWTSVRAAGRARSGSESSWPCARKRHRRTDAFRRGFRT